HGATRINNRDIKTDLTLADFTLPPPPVQPGSVAISDAADDRPTDAVYRNGSLWFAATADYFDGVNHWAQARYTVVNTAANGTAPTTGADFFGVLSGTHFFMPGVGIDADGLVIVSATKTDATSTYPTTVIGGIIPGIVLYPYVDVATSSTAYSGTRWGDFVGIAADPSGAGS